MLNLPKQENLEISKELQKEFDKKDQELENMFIKLDPFYYCKKQYPKG